MPHFRQEHTKNEASRMKIQELQPRSEGLAMLSTDSPSLPNGTWVLNQEDDLVVEADCTKGSGPWVWEEIPCHAIPELKLPLTWVAW